MATNQGLAYHRIFPRFYDLTRLRTGNVRDQMLRAIVLAHGLVHDSREIDDTPDGGLLVLGAGVAGVSCALAAAEKWVPVTLLEREGKAFTTLLSANWRRIAPYEFDWPHHSDPTWRFPWDLGAFGLKDFPLNYESDSAADVALLWQSMFDDWLAEHDPSGPNPRQLQFLRGLDIEHFKCEPVLGLDGAIIGVTATGPWNRQTPSSRTFGAVVLCAGCVRERTFDDRDPPQWMFRGHGFWTDEDHLEKDDFGVDPRLGTPKRILISGGGDGAMQDVQRAATGIFGRELLDKLLSALGDSSPSEHIVRLVLAEDRARRAYAWKTENGLTSDLPSEMKRWDKVFVSTVTAMLEQFRTRLNLPDEGVALKHLAPKVLKKSFLGAGQPHILWIMLEKQFGFAYALNRFLSHFLVRLLSSEQGTQPLRPRTVVHNILPEDPNEQCISPESCHGKTHIVELRNLDTGILSSEKFEIIILRHGLIFPDKPLLGGFPPVPEQMVPYDMPT